MAKKAGIPSGPPTPDLGPRTMEALTQFRSNMEALRHDAEAQLVRKRRRGARQASADPQQVLQRLLRQAQSLRAGIEKRAKRTSRDVGTQGEKLVSSLEKETARWLRPLLKRLDLPSRSEVRRLNKRIAELEKKLQASTENKDQPVAIAEASPSLPKP